MYRHVLCLVAAAGLLLGGSAAFAQDADTVDGFHAYGTPHANALLALDGSARLPGSAIAYNSIPGSRLVPGAVTAGRLGNNSVTTEKISDGQVMAADLAAGAVTRTKIANNSVTNTKIKNGTILGEDLGIPVLMGGNRNGYLVGCFNSNTGSSASGITGYSTATSGATRGVVGACSSPDGKAVYGIAKATTGTNYGVYGCVESNYGYAVYGYNAKTDVVGYLGSLYTGVRGNSHSSAGFGVWGDSDDGIGVFGHSANSKAGYFSGDCHVTGTFTSNDKQFMIDHPLDPENMYLHHACVESSERKNVYDGTVVLNAKGEAWVELPAWFDVLNCDFRYQLTAIGSGAPNLHIAQKIQEGWFRIAGGLPGMEVCWQVTGTRQDPYALAHPFEVEVEKPEVERGYYMHPELYGMPDTMCVEWATHPEAMMEMYRER